MKLSESKTEISATKTSTNSLKQLHYPKKLLPKSM